MISPHRRHDRLYGGTHIKTPRVSFPRQRTIPARSIHDVRTRCTASVHKHDVASNAFSQLATTRPLKKHLVERVSFVRFVGYVSDGRVDAIRVRSDRRIVEIRNRFRRRMTTRSSSSDENPGKIRTHTVSAKRHDVERGATRVRALQKIPWAVKNSVREDVRSVVERVVDLRGCVYTVVVVDARNVRLDGRGGGVTKFPRHRRI